MKNPNQDALEFWGAVDGVTGSKTLVRKGKHQWLIDCGLFQGLKRDRLKNWDRFPFDPAKLTAVLVTHAHLDHTGALPILARAGFRGKIYCSSPTEKLIELLLRDAANIQEYDASSANRKGYTKHHPAKPLFTQEEVERVLELLEPVRMEQDQELSGGASFRFLPNPHILGATSILLSLGDRTLLFSGDIARREPLLFPSAPPLDVTCDDLVIESTYGDRLHTEDPHDPEILKNLSFWITRALSRGGQILIPSFAVGRSQELLVLLSRLKSRSMIPNVPIYLDTPMGHRATEMLLDYPEWHHLSRSEIKTLEQETRTVISQSESIQIMRDANPAIILAGSGMLEGGRILHHLANRLPDPKNLVILTGFQAAGTRGRQLREGSKELKIHGHFIPVRAEIRCLDALSGHADQDGLLHWMKGLNSAPRRIFIQHGEPCASDALRTKLQVQYPQAEIHIPTYGDYFSL
jgi:metallo-beta-lactamase family protein